MKKIVIMSLCGAALFTACNDDVDETLSDASSFMPKVVFEIKNVSTLGGEADSLYITAAASLASADLDYTIQPISNLETESDTPWAAVFPGAKFNLNDKQFTDVSGKKTSKWEITTTKPVNTFALSGGFYTNTEQFVQFTYSYTVYKDGKKVDYLEKTVDVNRMPMVGELQIVQ